MRGARLRLPQLPDGAATADVLRVWDALPPVDVPDLLGRWRGSELFPGHPFDGLLTAHGWYGKEFVDAETVHPLLFADAAGRPCPLDPTLAPLTLLRTVPALFGSRAARLAFTAARPLLRTRRPQARVRRLEHRGVLTAALVYDRLPVLDVFRRVDADTVLGVMDLRGLAEPFPFVLHRDPSG